MDVSWRRQNSFSGSPSCTTAVHHSELLGPFWALRQTHELAENRETVYLPVVHYREHLYIYPWVPAFSRPDPINQIEQFKRARKFGASGICCSWASTMQAHARPLQGRPDNKYPPYLLNRIAAVPCPSRTARAGIRGGVPQLFSRRSCRTHSVLIWGAYSKEKTHET